jgi:hypothetical protein
MRNGHSGEILRTRWWFALRLPPALYQPSISRCRPPLFSASSIRTGTVQAIKERTIHCHGQNPETLAARFGKKSPKHSQQVAEMLETLGALGTL